MLTEAISSFLYGAINRLGMKLIDISTKSLVGVSKQNPTINCEQTDIEIWNIVTLYGKYKEVWSIYRTEGLLEAIKARDEKMQFDWQLANLENQHLQSSENQPHNIIQQQHQEHQIIKQSHSKSEKLNELDLAIVKSTISHFEKMPTIILNYYEHHHASKEEAKVLAKYYKETICIIQKVNTQEDLKNLIFHIKHLLKITDRYKHRKSKFRWSESLKRLLNKLESIVINV